MQGHSSLERVTSSTGRKDRLAWKTLTTTHRWLGAALEEWQVDGPGEFTEGFLLSHVVSVHVGVPVPRWIRWEGSPWRYGLCEPMTAQLMPAQISYSGRWDIASRRIGVMMTPAFLTSAAGASPREVIQLTPCMCLEGTLTTQLILALYADARAGSPCGSHYGESLVVALATHLARHNAVSRIPRSSRRGGDAASPRLRAACDYIDDNLACNLHLNEIAAVAQLELGQFIRTFKRAAGVSPHQYIMRQRIERGKALLRESKLSIVVVAERCGFSSASHFTNVFRKMTKVTPVEYRRTR